MKSTFPVSLKRSRGIKLGRRVRRRDRPAAPLLDVGRLGGPAAPKEAERVSEPSKQLAPAVEVGRPPPAPAVEVVSSSAALARPVGRPATLHDLLTAWLAGRAANTVKTYQRDLRAFADFLGVEDAPAAVGELLRRTGAEANLLAHDWLGEMDALGWAPATKARRLASLRSVTRMARRLGIVDWTLDVEFPKVQTLRDTRGPTEEELRRLFAAAGDGREGCRNRVLLLFMIVCGLRRAEVAYLRRRDYDKPGRRMLVHGKGGKLAWVSLPASVAGELEAWIDAEKIEDAAAPLLHGLRTPGVPLSLGGINGIVTDLGKRAGLHVWPHALRHSAVTTGLDVTDGDVRAVQRFARHSSPTTTMIYDDNRRDLGGDVANKVAERLLGKERE